MNKRCGADEVDDQCISYLMDAVEARAEDSGRSLTAAEVTRVNPHPSIYYY